MQNSLIYQNPPSRRGFIRAGGGTMGLMLASGFVMARGRRTESQAVVALASQPPAPEWTKDLIIYEIATRGFTSPHGPESGTFHSLKEKLPYLQELGITGIWLAGHSWAQPRYYYNVWSQYSNIDPEKIEPSLGNPEGFHSLIREAHGHGIRVFLDVHEHGVHPNSPLLGDHPRWFRTPVHDKSVEEFDWFGGHTDLDDWWVEIWTNCVTRYEVDGFRIDLGMVRPDLWARIRQNAAAAGHPIVIFEEHHSPIPGVSDFEQPWDNTLTDNQSGKLNELLAQNVPEYYDQKFGRAGEYRVGIRYADGSTAEGRTGGGKGTLSVRVDGLRADRTSRRQGDDHLDGIADVCLALENLSDKQIENVTVVDGWRGFWQMRSNGGRLLVLEGKPPSAQIFLATLGHGWPSIQLSCHDNGWDGFPLDASPYAAQGSRALFGYSFLFTGMIPIFFSGEEFDATFRPIPWLSPHYLGDQDAGKGRWLYGCMLDWEELNQPEHRAMFEDVQAMIVLRKREADILAVLPDREEPKLAAVPYEGSVPAPVPYIRWNDHGAILVAANRNSSEEAHLKMRIPLREIGLAGHGRYKVTELWPGAEAVIHLESELAGLACKVKRDRIRGGGLRILKIEPSS